MMRDDAGVRDDLPVPGWWIAALTALALALRLVRLNNGLWIDEIYAVLYSFRPSMQQIVSAFPRDNHHPFYAVLAHLSVSAFGESAWTVRLPAAIFGAATIPTLYLLGTRVATRREAFLAATHCCACRPAPRVVFAKRARIRAAGVLRGGRLMAAAARDGHRALAFLRVVRDRDRARRVHASHDGVHRGRACRCVRDRVRGCATAHADGRAGRWRLAFRCPAC